VAIEAIKDAVEGRQSQNNGSARIPFLSSNTAHFIFKKTIVGQLNDGFIKESLKCSIDNKHIAFANHESDKFSIIIDGKASKDCTGILAGTPIFSNNGGCFAYGAEHGNTNRLVVNGIEGREYSSIAGPTFSGDSRHFAYGAKKSLNWIVVEDEVECKYQYDGLTGIVLSNNGGSLAYSAYRGNKNFVVFKANESKAFEGIMEGTPIVSDDGKRFAYVGIIGDDYYIVLDSIIEMSWHGVLKGEFLFSKDSKIFAYAALDKNGKVFVINGSQKSEYDIAGGLTFSSDGKHLAYFAKRRGKWVVVMDSKEGAEYDGICKDSPVFAPSGQRLAYCGVRGKKCIVTIDGVESKPYDTIGAGLLLFSNNGEAFGYMAKVGKAWFTVINGVESKKYDAFAGVGLTFNEDGKHYACPSVVDQKQVMIVDGVETETRYDGLGHISFSKDNHFAYNAKINNEEIIVIDDVAIKDFTFEGLVAGTTLTFDDPRTLNALAVKNNIFYRLEIRVVDE
jgi:hypothetical protein